MGRTKILKASGCEKFIGHSINSKYDLCACTLLLLENTLEHALSHFNMITAVRLDFSIKKAPQDQYIGYSNSDIMYCFNEFMNRLYKEKNMEYLVNWKLEWSKPKGFHIHSVFYFNHRLTKTFTNNSNVYEIFRFRWDNATDGNGNINICSSCIAPDEDSYRVRGEHEYQYVLLTKKVELLNKIKLSDKAKQYHQQKNLLDKKCGFYHWISYLAKTEQLAPQHNKCFGTRRKL